MDLVICENFEEKNLARIQAGMKLPQPKIPNIQDAEDDQQDVSDTLLVNISYVPAATVLLTSNCGCISCTYAYIFCYIIFSINTIVTDLLTNLGIAFAEII